MSSSKFSNVSSRLRFFGQAISLASPGRILSRNGPFAAFIAGIVIYGSALALYMLDHFDKFDIINYSFDDAYYYFQIAWHLAEGKFSTFDGGITRTNGYHPLWMFLITPFYWIFDMEAALFGIKVLEIILISGAVALLSGAARAARQPWILFFAAPPMLYRHGELYGGMEPAAALFMLGLLFLAVCLYARDAVRWRLLLAAAAFALPWVRLEYVAVSLASTVALWVTAGRNRGAHAAAASQNVSSFLSSVPTVGAIAGLLAYFAYNQMAFGGIVPVSGATKAAWAQMFWAEEGGYSVARAFQDTLHLPAFHSGLPVAAEVCVYFLIVWQLVRRFEDREGRGLLAFLVCMGGLAAVHIAQFAYAVANQHPAYIPSWYHAPAYLLAASVVPVRCFVAIHLVRRFVAPKSVRLANALRTGILLASVVTLFANVDFAAPFSIIDHVSNPESASYRGLNGNNEHAHLILESYGNAQIANRVLPEGSVIGSWDAGKTAYFSHFPVVNLDGLVNSWDYFRAIYADENLDWFLSWRLPEEPHLKSYYREFYRKFGITHLANPVTPFYFYDDATQLGSTLSALHVETASHKSGWLLSTLEPLEEFDAGAWFWQKMQPHFDIRLPTLGVAVDGRLAHAVARDCEPEELLFWRWGDSPNDTALRRLTKTITGVCTDVILLPHGVASPVSVERDNNFVERMIGGRQPQIRSGFDVWANPDENILIYRKDRCKKEDIEMRFFLHVIPVDPDVLPERFKHVGIGNFDFNFDQYGQRLGESCLAVKQLPEYPIASIRTGQFKFVDGNFHNIWQGAFDPSNSADWGAHREGRGGAGNQLPSAARSD